MNIDAFKGNIKPRGEPQVITRPFEETDAVTNYRIDDLKTGFYRKLEDLCTTIYDYEGF